ncbi:MAG: hypothetical protein HY396_01080 [Candidatus Doudnabacteria bacterium]|nr:hypothetical protein [Candidatus Doudnabacteria bacterium]
MNQRVDNTIIRQFARLLVFSTNDWDEDMESKIKTFFSFGLNFLKNPLRNASIMPSSQFASRAILHGVDFSHIDTIVELGPGTGVLTEEILKRCRPNTKILLIEIEKSYAKTLQNRYGDRVIVENKSAHLLGDILKKHGMNKADLIISGLPFLPKEMKDELFNSIKQHTNRGAIFRFFTYMPPIMKQIYKDLPIRKISFVLRNFPPVWIYGIN